MRLVRSLSALALATALLSVGTTTLAQTPEPMARPLQPAADSPLEGTSWRLRDYRHRDIERSAGPEVAAWMQLRGGRLVGSGGCNRLRGSYGHMGAAFKVNLSKTKEPDCGEQTTLVQLGMIAGLDAAASFQLLPGESTDQTELAIFDPAGLEVLHFVVDDPGVLASGEWRLEAYTVAGQRIDAEPSQPAVLSFQPGRSIESRRRSSGDAVGSSGCNGIVGEYFRHADVLSFGELDRTDAPCTPTLAAQEAALVAVLDSTSSSLRLPPDRLILTSTDSGDQLEFVSAHPLEETTWLLSKLGKAKAPSEPVTLSLRSGSASGEGPCGPYMGDYTTNGVFITFTALVGSAGDSCPGRDGEADLLGALRRTVLLDRSGADLHMLDAAGKELARFSYPGAP